MFYCEIFVVTRQVPLYYYHTIRVPRVFLWNLDYRGVEWDMVQVMYWYNRERGRADHVVTNQFPRSNPVLQYLQRGKYYHLLDELQALKSSHHLNHMQKILIVYLVAGMI